DVDLYTDS
nr:Chain C, Spermatogenesis-associated protein 2 [Homo sapiens]5LJN_D Chain D, Spermatogenesis-associated protein 2 [Homo sapiens]